MRHVRFATFPIATLYASLSIPAAALAQSPTIVGHSVDASSSHAGLELQLSNDQVISIMLADGEIRINGNVAGRYAPNGPLEQSWRSLLDSAASLNTTDLAKAAKRWASVAGPDIGGRKAVGSAITGLTAIPPEVAHELIPPPPPHLPAEAEFREPVFNPNDRPRAGFAGVGPTLAGLVGSFVALAAIAFGLVSFAPRQLNIVSDTVQQSFIRSFFAGLFAQPLILPALATLVIGLVLTVVGILVVPFAIIGFCLALSLGVVGGYIAAARALGEVYLRRKMARGIMVSADPTFRAIIFGLVGLLTIWAPFALFGWVPGFGVVLLGAAILFTWIMATVGLGATILSRAGLRASFGRQVTPQLSGELSWSTVDEIAPSKRAGEGSVP